MPKKKGVEFANSLDTGKVADNELPHLDLSPLPISFWTLNMISKSLSSEIGGKIHRVATVREKYFENEIFSRPGKSQGTLFMAREI